VVAVWCDAVVGSLLDTRRGIRFVP